MRVVGTISAPDAPVVEQSDVDRRRWTVPCWVHVLVHLMLLVAVAASTDLDVPWNSDGGAYGSQALIVETTGSWGYEAAPTWGTPPTELRTFGKSEVVDGVEFPYVKHPVWIEFLLLVDDVSVPVVGLAWLGVLGAVGAAWAAWSLAPPRPWARMLAYWTVALGPPFVWALDLWAHAPAAGLGGLLAVGLVRWCRRPSAGALLAMAVAVGGTTLIRSEGLLFAVAVVGAIVVHAVMERRRPGALVSGLVASGVVGVAAVAAKAVDFGLMDRLAPGALSVRPTEGSPWLAGRIDGFEATFVRGGFTDPAHPIGVLALVVLLVGSVLLVRRQVRLGAMVLLAGVAVYAMRSIWLADEALPSLFVGAPLLVVGLIAVPWTRLSAGNRALAVFAAGYVGLVVATQYPEGGALDWGGRFVAPALVALVALAVHGVVELADRLFTDQRRLLLVAVAALAVLPVVPGVVAPAAFRDRHVAIVEDVEATGAPTAIAVEWLMPLLSWRTLDDVVWTTVDPKDVRAIVTRARDAGEVDLVLVGRTVDVDELTGLGYSVERVSPFVIHLTASRGPSR